MRRLPGSARCFPACGCLLFGFGERAWLLHRRHDFADTLAALLPGSGALLVTALRVPPQLAFPPEDVVTLHVSAGGLARLNDFISRSFEWAPDGALRSIADGPYAGSLFYASTMQVQRRVHLQHLERGRPANRGLAHTRRRHAVRGRGGRSGACRRGAAVTRNAPTSQTL